MINHKRNSRAAANLLMLELMAKKLGKLCNEVVFVGGCTTALFITDSAAPDVRSTLDIDCIVDVISITKYQQFESKLKNQGFKKPMNEGAYRWCCGDLILDVMPTDKKILGFGNIWYPAAIKKAVIHQVSDVSIKSVTVPYFLATKLEAFKDRGKNDFLGSHDLEDIIAVIDGRPELISDISLSDSVLQEYLKKTFSKLLEDLQFTSALPGHLNAGPVTETRVQLVLHRIRQIVDLVEV